MFSRRNRSLSSSDPLWTNPQMSSTTTDVCCVDNVNDGVIVLPLPLTLTPCILDNTGQNKPCGLYRTKRAKSEQMALAQALVVVVLGGVVFDDDSSLRRSIKNTTDGGKSKEPLLLLVVVVDCSTSGGMPSHHKRFLRI